MKPGELREYDMRKPGDALRHHVDLEEADPETMVQCGVLEDNRIKLVFGTEYFVIMDLEGAEMLHKSLGDAIGWAKEDL